MLERSRFWSPRFALRRAVFLGACAGVAGCALLAPEEPAPATAPAAAAVAAPATAPAPAGPKVDPRARTEEARALVAQAETDIQRARARRALWSRAWEALVEARARLAANDATGAIREARRASEFAQLGLEQLAYPAVRITPAPAAPAAGS
ncbi:MAG: hypothetical protein KJ007_19165 [Burkholderiales bacterium]|nr:hypothetical protein [Burkholderiales bacterium]